MIVAKTGGTVPVAANTPVAEGAQSGGPTFASILDEIATVNQDCGTQLPPGSSPAVSLRELADRAVGAVKGNDKDDGDSTDASLLTLLNLTLGSTPEAVNKEQDKVSLADDSDTEKAPLPVDSAQPQPVPLVAAVDLQPVQTPAALPEDTGTIEDTVPHSAGDKKEDHVAVSALSMGTKPAFDPRTVAAGKSGQEAAQIAGDVNTRSVVNDISGGDIPSPQLISNTLTEKGNVVSHEADQTFINADFNTLAAQAAQSAGRQDIGSVSDHRTDIESLSGTGVLTQEMGTPAWQQSLGQQIASFTRNGVQHAELRLHPEELGSLQISLQLKNEQAQLHFVSASHQVRAALEAAVPHLRTSLAESGIELGQSSIGAETSSSWNWNESAQSGQKPQHNFTGQEHPENAMQAEDRVETPVRTGVYRRGINTFA